MQLFVLGLNHKTAPVEVRERLALAPDRLPHALRYVRRVPGVREAAILSTCNRTEILTFGDDDAAPRLEQLLGDFHDAPLGLGAYLYRLHDDDGARHLLRVASGLDSLVLGESQILGQVKTALEAARQAGTLGPTLDELFRRAISCGKRAREETGIGRGSLSVGSAAVELARHIFGPLEGRAILLLGAGKISSLTAQHLVSSGAREVLVANRTPERAHELVAQFGQIEAQTRAAAMNWNDVPHRLHQSDIVIASTGASGFVLSAQQIGAAMQRRRDAKNARPLLLIDIAVPRDIEPLPPGEDNVFLYDIDDLREVVEANRAQRSVEIAPVETIIEEELRGWTKWQRGQKVQPILAQLARRTDEIRAREVEKTLAQLPDLSPREREIIEALARSLSAKLMHPALRHLRQAAQNESGDIEALRRAFDLDENASDVEQS